ncbi:MAG: hypothetical protein KGR26_14560 [Cyanobacteria bacterium REEB65]|nr:hypothetical protein [Cyanobacteria bacterium REEB65]
MRSTKLWAAAAVLALSLPAPALAATVTPTGELFTNYSLPTMHGTSSFGAARLRIGANANFSDSVFGKVMFDLAPNLAGSAAVPSTPFARIKFGYLGVNAGYGTWTMGQQATLWQIPYEEQAFPRYIAPSLTESEDLMPNSNTGLTFKTGGASWGGVGLDLGYFNGWADYNSPAPAVPGDKSDLEARLGWGSGPLSINLFGRGGVSNNMVNQDKQGVLSLGYNGGAFAASLEGVMDAMPAATTTATGSTGMGGSLALSLPNVGGSGFTPMVRADLYSSGINGATTATDNHVRAIIAIEKQLAPGVSVALDDQYIDYLSNANQTGNTQLNNNTIAVHSRIVF